MNLENLNLVQSTLGNLQIFSFLHRKRRQNCTIQSPNFSTFKDPGHQFHRIDSLWEFNSVVELILGDIVPMWRNWRFQNCRHNILCLGKVPVSCHTVRTWRAGPLLSLWDFVHVGVFCTFRTYHGSCSSWVCQELAAEHLLGRAGGTVKHGRTAHQKIVSPHSPPARQGKKPC